MTDYTVSSGQSVAKLGLHPGDSITVNDGGTVTEMRISGVTAWIYGATSNTVVHSGGIESLVGGFYGFGYYASGGHSFHTTVLSGGTQTVGSGGMAVGTVVRNGGYLAVSGQSFFSYPSQIASAVDAKILTGGRMDVQFASVSGTVIDGGVETILTGATVTGTHVRHGGHEILTQGVGPSGPPRVFDTVVEAGGVQDVLGTDSYIYPTLIASAEGTIIRAGGRQELWAGSNGGQGGVAANTIVSSGGLLEVHGLGATGSTGALAIGTSIQAGGFALVSSGAVMSSTSLTGTLIVMSGGTADRVDDESGRLIVSNGGTAAAVTIAGSGFARIEGTLFCAVIYGSGAARVLGGGVLEHVTLGSGGTAYVDSGATASSTAIASGGALFIRGGGVAAGSVVESSGLEFVGRGGLDIGTVVSSGGQAFIFSAGTVSGGTVMSGGKLKVYAGGQITGGLTLAGGQASVLGSVQAGQSVALSGTGNSLSLSNLPDFHAEIAGFTAGDQIDLAAFGYRSGVTKLSWSQTAADRGTLTVTTGATAGSLTLDGHYQTANFQLAADGKGGTLIRLH